MGLNSAFLHCQSLDVKVGDRVVQGQRLGTVGRTWRATGPHLHWGLKWRDARLDPATLAGPMPRSLFCCAATQLVTYETKCRTEEHQSELQSLIRQSSAVFCLTNQKIHTPH